MGVGSISIPSSHLRTYLSTLLYRTPAHRHTRRPTLLADLRMDTTTNHMPSGFSSCHPLVFIYSKYVRTWYVYMYMFVRIGLVILLSADQFMQIIEIIYMNIYTSCITFRYTGARYALRMTSYNKWNTWSLGSWYLIAMFIHLVRNIYVHRTLKWDTRDKLCAIRTYVKASCRQTTHCRIVATKSRWCPSRAQHGARETQQQSSTCPASSASSLAECFSSNKKKGNWALEMEDFVESFCRDVVEEAFWHNHNVSLTIQQYMRSRWYCCCSCRHIYICTEYLSIITGNLILRSIPFVGMIRVRCVVGGALLFSTLGRRPVAGHRI